MSQPRRILASSPQEESEEGGAELRLLARALLELAIQLLEDEIEEAAKEAIEEAA